MSVTYPHDRPMPLETRPEMAREEPYVPVYARTRSSTRGRKGGVKTWMILAPLGVLVLGGVATALIVGDRAATPDVPLAEPAATGPVLPAQPLISEAAPLEASAATATVEAVPEPVVRAAPAPERRAAPAPARRAAAPAPAPATREAPAQPDAPQPYTSSLNATPPATPAPAPAAPPVIIIQPAG